MRNFVAKHDFNRASTHKTEKDYSRLSSHDLAMLAEEAQEELWNDDLMEDLYWAELHQEEDDYFAEMASIFRKHTNELTY